MKFLKKLHFLFTLLFHCKKQNMSYKSYGVIKPFLDYTEFTIKVLLMLSLLNLSVYQKNDYEKVFRYEKVSLAYFYISY